MSRSPSAPSSAPAPARAGSGRSAARARACLLEADHLAAQPTHLPAQGVDVVGDVVLVGLGWRPGRRCGYAPDRDLLVRRPRFFARRARVACPLNAGADLVALLERDRTGCDLPF